MASTFPSAFTTEEDLQTRNVHHVCNDFVVDKCAISLLLALCGSLICDNIYAWRGSLKSRICYFVNLCMLEQQQRKKKAAECSTRKRQ